MSLDIKKDKANKKTKPIYKQACSYVRTNEAY